MPEYCSECGADVATAKGHERNWPRLIVRDAKDLADACTKMMIAVDTYNAEFAIPEFAAAMQERFGVAERAK